MDGSDCDEDVRILVVDDMCEVRQLLRMILENAGYEVVEAASGAETLDAMRTQTYDVAIVDVNLPDCNGLQLAESIRETDLTGQIKLLYITGDSAMAQELGSSQCDIEGYIIKPFGVEELLEKLSVLCRKSR
ncbi:MAG: response regulator [candidate division WS1 bacterium]|jgi:DNA-binding response OmpR family regulator|nr:response regulator [candidate division WS1 bacterium]